MNPKPLTADEFTSFFHELWNYDPFPWQTEFARRICASEWPDYVTAPTGSGKTACLDAAVFALAVQAGLPELERTQGRRIFFVVNRRVIVDEAYNRSGQICKMLAEANPDSVLGRVAAALRRLIGDPACLPLQRTQLRGGIYLDRSWAGSLLQPMIVCSTVDQVGSRLLFRGYGVSPQARPINAALIAQDSLLIIDEAHISKPFVQTLEWVQRYRSHEQDGCEVVKLPFRIIQMTATPPADIGERQRVALTEQDRTHPVLSPRLSRPKLASLLVEEKAKGKGREDQMAKRLAKEVREILSTGQPRSALVMANRVATARMVYHDLKKEHGDSVRLLIGRLRPLDRDAVTKDIQNRLKTGVAPSGEQLIVVSTQCLEVGADLDFDVLVTEAASLDALRQRFGRLNRAGRDIVARAVIVMPGDQCIPEEKLDDIAPCDPIYGNAIPRTWHGLQAVTQDGKVDFGVNSMVAAIEGWSAAIPAKLSAMLSPAEDAPVMLPAYLDCWVQTNPAPAADPDIAIFLHGPQRDMAEVEVCWRADLPAEEDQKAWTETLSLCPPVSIECLPIPLHIFRQWMNSSGKFNDLSSDAAETAEAPEKKGEEQRDVQVLIWRGPNDSTFAKKAADIRPGDTIILRAQDGGWDALGHLPNAPEDPQSQPDSSLTDAQLRIVDLAEEAAATARRRAVLRIHCGLWPTAEKTTAAGQLKLISTDEEADWSKAEIKELLERLLHEDEHDQSLTAQQRSVVKHFVECKSSELLVESYPDNSGFVISSRMPMRGVQDDDAYSMGADGDADALLEATGPQNLSDHTRDVIACVESMLALLPLSPWHDALVTAAALHDWGKADLRFQAMLRSTSLFAAMASGTVLAKSGDLAVSAAGRRAARTRAGLPDRFRHEMLSLQMAQTKVGSTFLPVDPAQGVLVLHLIATHHGYARPLAPVVEDEAPPDASIHAEQKTVLVTSADRLEHPAHALDSGIAERFWKLTRCHGWWGLALLEAVLRLADQTASANRQPTSTS